MNVWNRVCWVAGLGGGICCDGTGNKLQCSYPTNTVIAWLRKPAIPKDTINPIVDVGFFVASCTVIKCMFKLCQCHIVKDKNMAKSGNTIPFWAESALQAIYHIDNLCGQANEGRGVWVSTPALVEAMSLKRVGKYHRGLLDGLVKSKWLEHRQGGRYKTHEYKLTETARKHMADRLARACGKCTPDGQHALFFDESIHGNTDNQLEIKNPI